MSANGDKPTLWHIPISHYNEKVRWALAHKRVEHERKAPMPGIHQLVALGLTRGKVSTFPVMRLDGEIVGDSTAIIAALEERYPDPPLYPAADDERARALEIEDYFDEQLGPYIRLYAYHELMEDDEGFARVAATMSPAPLHRFAAPTAKAMVKLRFGAGDERRVADARARVLAALDRLEAELDGNDYLVGDGFTVADLSAASLFYPLVAPPEGPTIETASESLEAFRAPLRERPGYRYVERMFSSHRKPAA